MKIEVFYTERCAQCRLIEHVVYTALEEMGMDVPIHKVTNQQEAIDRGARAQPVLWINGDLKTQGRMPLVSEVKDMIEQARVDEAP